MAHLLEATEEEQTPLQRGIGRVGRMLGIAVIVIAVVVVAAILLTSDIEDASDVVDVLLVGVSLAVAAGRKVSRRSCRSCWPWGCSGWPAGTPS